MSSPRRRSAPRATRQPSPPGPVRRRRPTTTTTSSSSASSDDFPWTSLSVPVYSLATTGGDHRGAGPSMNVTTYCSAVGIKPVRRYALGLYVGTLTAYNFKANGVGVLQILNRNQAGAIDLLGRRSGRDVDKIDLLERDHGLEVERWHGIPIIRGCTAGLLLKWGESMTGEHDCGDHDVVLCDVCDVYAGDRAAPVLTTGFLRDRGLL